MPPKFKRWVPTKKWFAALVGSSTPIALQAVDSGWHVGITKQAIVVASGLLIAYITSNDPAVKSSVPAVVSPRRSDLRK